MPRESLKIADRLCLTAAFILVGILFTIPSYRLIEAHSPIGWRVPAKEKKLKNPVPKTLDSVSRGQKIYLEKCALCHGLKGDGQGEMGKALDPHPPDLTDEHMMKEMTDGEIYWKITTGKDPMPSYQKELSENERWDLVNYLRSLVKSK